MTRPIRDWDPESFRLITIRTCEGRLWLSPTGKVRKLMGGIVARYQELLGIEIYSYCFLGNHFHLLIRAPLGNTDEFCENVDREIARRINWKFRREGKLWGRRYDDQKVLSEQDLLEAFLYVTTNATKHGLVRDSKDWPGLSAFKHVLTEQNPEFNFYHFSKGEEVPLVTRHKLRISILPQFESLPKSRRRAHLEKLLDERMELFAKERRANLQGFLGLAAINQQSPGELPQKVSRTPRPCCYTKCAELRKDFKQRLKARLIHYREASARFRLGLLETIFPQHSFKPPLHRLPRFLPFKPITLAELC